MRGGKGIWNRTRITTYIAAAHQRSLRVLSERTGIPVGRLIDQSLSDFLEAVGMQEEPSVPPIDKQYLRQRMRSEQATRTGQKEPLN